MKLRSIIVAAPLFATFQLVGCKTAEVQTRQVAPTQSVAQTATAESAFQQGITAFEKSDFTASKSAFETALSRDPKMAGAQYNLGVIEERNGNLQGARAAYEKAHAIDPTHRPALLNLGKVYRLMGQPEAAVKLYEKVLSTPPLGQDVQLLNNLTTAYRLTRQFDKAEATARRVLSRTKGNADAYKNLALIYYDQGNYRLAEFISSNAKKLDEKDPGIYNNLGIVYLKMDERPRALAQFQKSVSLDAKFSPGYMNIGAMALSYRDYEAAERAFGKAIELEPARSDAHLFYGYALDGQRARDPKKGIAAGASFEKAIALRPDLNEAVCGAGWAYTADKSTWNKANEFLQRCDGFESTSAQDRQLIGAKLKALASIQSAAAAAAAAPQEKKEARPSGPSMLDKVSAQEGSTPEDATGTGGADAAGTPEAPGADQQK